MGAGRHLRDRVAEHHPSELTASRSELRAPVVPRSFI